MKRCCKCGVEKHESEFSHDRQRKDGYQSWCKECRQEYIKVYRKENKEKISEYLRENKKRQLEYQKVHYRKNKDKKLKQQKEYRRSNKDKISKQNKEYCQTLNGKLSRTRGNHNRRALYKKECSDMTFVIWTKILELQNNKCNICHKRFTKKRPPTQDHIVPISKGGSLRSENIQALCLSCNSSKQAKLDNSYIQTWCV